GKWCTQGAQKWRTTMDVDRANGAPKAHRSGARQWMSTGKTVRPRCAHRSGARQW
ncbi:hypothetical protein KI387_029770, partial [Taxus chinensis]